MPENTSEDITVEKHEEVKSKIQERKKIFVIFAVMAVIIIIGFLTKGFGLFSTNIAETPTEIKIPLSEISEKAEWKEYDSGGAKIKFFVVKANDGSIKTAFDACDVCYRNKRGYRQERNDMVCNNCGRRFAIISLGTENKNPGGCWPGYLLNKIEDNNVVIKESDLEKGKWRFK